ncbi:LTA synthase family protein [Fibrisoma montanum]|uniref:LTA synthase family protein n=1 Tax=Fibrisoma montanum TaxID=2305895 RepID=A0A418MAD9_9BACT|nr:LTA synthase family protein [Fibrisoma montanum]RIV23320.1 LTA synthase family protein [Fibrisoma montanum]
MKYTVTSGPQPVSDRLTVVSQFAGLSVGWLICLVVCRIGELIYNSVSHGIPESLPTVVASSLLIDVIYFLQSSFVLFVVFFLLSFLSGKLARTVYVLLCLLLMLIQLGLIVYFGKTSVLLGADLYSYSPEEIQQTVGAAGGLSAGLVAGIVALVVLVLVIFRFVSFPLQPTVRWSAGFIGLVVIATVFNASTWLSEPVFKTEYVNNLVVNKPAYLAQATIAHFSGPVDEGVDIYADAYIGDYGESTTTESKIQQISYLAENQYPFLHADDTPDVLGPFFNQSPTPPHVVILIVEGLGRAFTGTDAYLGSFTPFIDSLAQRSLYWENFLSEGGRTFAVLPSILGSLPFATQGFSDLGSRMPDHLSLTGILRKNGYQPAFYYGGSAQFDNMNGLLRKQGVSRIFDEPTFGSGYQKMPGINGFTWGYGDKDLFRHYFAVNDPSDTRPKLQVLLTVSTHDPFKINEQTAYLQKAEQRYETLGLTEDQKQDHRQYTGQFASILYMDDALRQFFDTYRNRPDFNNTIFLITGDHRMPEIPMTTKLDRYHVPLIVYSPLLKRRATFRSISTHFDIAPTLLAFLRKNYQLKTPAIASWLGIGIDTTRQFQNVHAYPLKMTKAELSDFVMGPYMLNQKTLYRINPNMNLEPVSEPGQLSRLNATFEQYKRKNDKFLTDTKLVPDSVLARYK